MKRNKPTKKELALWATFNSIDNPCIECLIARHRGLGERHKHDSFTFDRKILNYEIRRLKKIQDIHSD